MGTKSAASFISQGWEEQEWDCVLLKRWRAPDTYSHSVNAEMAMRAQELESMNDQTSCYVVALRIRAKRMYVQD